MEMLKHQIKCINNALRQFKKGIQCCVLCGNPSRSELPLCSFCYNDLPTITQQFKNNLLQAPVVHRHISHQHIDRLCCLASYQWPYNLWIQQLKYQQNFEQASLLAWLLAKHFTDQFNAYEIKKETTLTAVPIHVKRWQERGYNQSDLIARKLAKLTRISYQKNLVQRIKATDKQVGKSGVARRKNIKNAFTVIPQPNLMPKHIILIDDVITTGTTANEIARTLKKSGVLEVTVFTVAIAIDKLQTR